MDQAEYRRLQKLIEPCLTPEDLDEYIQTHLGIELPWDTVDQDSTSAPLSFIWAVNNTMITGTGSHRHVLAAARNTAKTLGSAILQFIALLHYRRDANHLAATIEQSSALIRYIDQFMRIPDLFPYQNTDNVRRKEFINLPPNDYTSKSTSALQVITASKKGANSSRCLDAKTEVTTYRDSDKGGMFRPLTVKGIWSRFEKGEDVYVASVDNKTGEIQKKKVINSTRKIDLKRITIKTESGKLISSTLDHMHACGYKDGKIVYKFAEDFNEGDYILTKALGSHGKVVCDEGACAFMSCSSSVIFLDKIKNIEFHEEDARHRNRWVYDITVKDNHNFFANQVLTHNCSFITFDEVDLTPAGILSEAAFILDPTRDGRKFDPIAVYLSSRKSNDGTIQDLIDESESADNKTDDDPITLHKWSSVDWQEKCVEEVSRKSEGDNRSWIHSETLKTVWTEDEFNLLSINQKAEYIERKSFAGCVKCPAWIACQGRAVNQKGLSPMLRQRSFVGRILKGVKDPSQIIAQALNWKPETSGLVFRMFSKYHHLKDYQDFYEYVSLGERYNPNGLTNDELDTINNTKNARAIHEITPTKDQIYRKMGESGWRIIAGVDFGHSPDPAICLISGYHEKMDLVAILHCDYANGFANHRWAEHSANTTLDRFPVEWVAPDMADKSAPSYFAKHDIRSLDKKPSRIEPGVSYIRGMLWDAVSNCPRLAILDDSPCDNKNEFIINEFEKYAHARDVNGKIHKDKYVDDFNHGIDSLRYLLAPFADKKRISASAVQFAKTRTNRDLVIGAAANDKKAIEKIREKEEMMNQLKTHMEEEHGLTGIFGKPAVETKEGSKTQKSKSGIKFSI